MLLTFGKLFYFLNFSHWQFKWTANFKEPCFGFNPGIIYTVFFLCPESLSVVIFTLFRILYSCSVMFPFLQYINVLKSALSKPTTLSEFYTPTQFCSCSKVCEEPSCSLLFSAPAFFHQTTEIWFLILLILWNHSHEDQWRYPNCEMKSKGPLSVDLTFHLCVALDIDGCSLLSEPLTPLFSTY